MSHTLDFLSDNDVRQINRLVETLDRSNFDYFQIDIGELKVTIGKGALPTGGAVAAPMAAPTIAAPAPATAAPAAAPATPSPSPAAQPRAAAPEAGWAPITATTMGRFYSRPDPSSPPYVSVGDTVTADSTVCLIEVMKLFNAIPAGVAGTIAQVCVQDAEVVEFGQVLFYVKP
ncbi:acetyl-CoA carboxylase biotin carboxyl carrier protein subunit [Ramlibacter sp. AW1]|uniref:Biotin carboxyl carrier protein of acetyl-CoA carboxylase n=1 Tax=Ramlibacter aurantiacus TaxID=2801330 RepID=A0A937D4Q6_9BURK|nr:biotin/lipoyl-containing protein [Ramlibacter aurantiacus]MBL0421970.1 acetyl-CoA carboxylase biotin carboxyl carrier protein subunit [Ramlibacter aurantiacus]